HSPTNRRVNETTLALALYSSWNAASSSVDRVTSSSAGKPTTRSGSSLRYPKPVCTNALATVQAPIEDPKVSTTSTGLP
ncbi:hypothetical protein GNI_172250, partial [Gregarina niphandrodes]